MQFGKRFLVTGGAGFIGSAFIRFGLNTVSSIEKIVNLDLLTYAGNLLNLASIENDPRYAFLRGDICDEALVLKLCEEYNIDTIVHFAAESHVDRSIIGPKTFLETNVLGTFALLEVVRKYPHIHFHHISTDEVYGSLGDEGFFNEESKLSPSSPYSASKAASDCFVGAYARTYNLSTTISHCSNNYGPFQHAEKLIPFMINCCINKTPMPVYGSGKNVRDWIYVDDHVEALWQVLQKGKKGQVYDMGGSAERRNIDLIHLIISEFAKIKNEDPQMLCSLITHVPDRLGHDYRYAIDSSKIQKELGWTPRHQLEEGLKKTILWSLRENSLCHSCKT